MDCKDVEVFKYSYSQVPWYFQIFRPVKYKEQITKYDFRTYNGFRYSKNRAWMSKMKITKKEITEDTNKRS